MQRMPWDEASGIAIERAHAAGHEDVSFCALLKPLVHVSTKRLLTWRRVVRRVRSLVKCIVCAQISPPILI